MGLNLSLSKSTREEFQSGKLDPERHELVDYRKPHELLGVLCNIVGVCEDQVYWELTKGHLEEVISTIEEGDWDDFEVMEEFVRFAKSLLVSTDFSKDVITFYWSV